MKTKFAFLAMLGAMLLPTMAYAHDEDAKETLKVETTSDGKTEVDISVSKPKATEFKLGFSSDLIAPPDRALGTVCGIGLRLTAQRHLTDELTAGGRLGLNVGSPFWEVQHLSVPMDAVVGVHFSGMYVEGMLGTWVTPVAEGKSALALHKAMGMGVENELLAFGAEAGWLDKDPMVGLNLALKF